MGKYQEVGAWVQFHGRVCALHAQALSSIPSKGRKGAGGREGEKDKGTEEEKDRREGGMEFRRGENKSKTPGGSNFKNYF